MNGSEQKLLRRLGVFLGGCTLEAAEAVCNTRNDLGAEIFDVMSSLVDKSLVQQTEQGDDEPRFGMLETIREYCLERLGDSGEEQATRRAHAAYCLVLAEEGNPDLAETERAAWLARCDIEHDNFRAALDWLIQSSDVEWSFRLCVALFRFWEMREHLAEGRARLESASAHGRIRVRQGTGQSAGLPFHFCDGAARFSGRYGFCGTEPVDLPELWAISGVLPCR